MERGSGAAIWGEGSAARSMFTQEDPSFVMKHSSWTQPPKMDIGVIKEGPHR